MRSGRPAYLLWPVLLLMGGRGSTLLWRYMSPSSALYVGEEPAVAMTAGRVDTSDTSLGALAEGKLGLVKGSRADRWVEPGEVSGHASIHASGHAGKGHRRKVRSGYHRPDAAELVRQQGTSEAEILQKRGREDEELLMSSMDGMGRHGDRRRRE